MHFKKGLLSRTRFPEANCPKKQFSHKSGEGPRMWTVLSQHCQLFLEPFGKDLFGSFPGSCGTFPGSCGSTRFGLAVFCFFSWMMWHFSWIIWLYSVWPCNFLLLFLDDVALFLDHLALLNLALQFYSFLTPYTCSLMLARRPFCECKPQCIPACPQCIQTSIYIHIYICLASFTRYYCLALSNMSFPCNAMRCCFTGLAEALANKN